MSKICKNCKFPLNQHTKDNSCPDGFGKKFEEDTFCGKCARMKCICKKPKNHSPLKESGEVSAEGISHDTPEVLEKSSQRASGTSKSLTTPGYPKMIKTGTSKLNGKKGCGKKKSTGCDEMGWLDCGDKVGVWKGKKWVWTKDFWLCNDCKLNGRENEKHKKSRVI